MNKKLNTLLFIAGATLFNILITVLSFLLLFFISLQLAALFKSDDVQNNEVLPWLFFLSFIGGMVLSFIIYRLAIKLLTKKIDFDKYFDPIFSGKRRRGVS